MTFNYKGLIKRALALAFILAILFFVAQSTILPGIIEQALKQSLEENGFPVQQFKMRTVSWSRADFSDVILGEQQNAKIDSLQTDYDIYSLLKGHVKTIRISGAQFTTQWNRKSIINITQKAYHSGQQSGLPFDQIDISSSSLLFIRNNMRLRIPFEGSVRKSDKGISFAINAELLGGFTTIAGETTAHFELTRLALSLNGLNAGLIPQTFLPAAITAPLQGHLHGSLSIEKDQSQWHTQSDLSIRLSGEYNQHSFQISQARLINNTLFDTANRIKTLQADIGIEQTHFSRYAVQNLSISITNIDQQLHADISGNGTQWDFQRINITLSDFPGLISLFYPNRETPIEIPHLTATVSKFHNRINKVRMSIESILFRADILRTQNGLRCANSEIEVSDGLLAQGSMLIQGVSGIIRIEEFIPLTTKGSQRIQIDTASFGDIVLNDGRLLLQSAGTDKFLVERCDWVWCDGRITGRPFHFNLASPETKITAFFEDISLAQLLAVAVPDKIEGSALLYGRIPIRLRSEPNIELTFGNGNLYSVPAYGKLSIKDPSILKDILMGAQADHQPASSQSWRTIVSDVVADYRYNILKVNLKRIHANGLAGELQMRGNGAPPDSIPLGLNIPIHIR